MNTGKTTIETRAHRSARYFTGVLWHAGTYLIVGVLLMVLDLVGSGRLGWSIWVIGFWGMGLAFHILAYLIEGRGIEEHLVQDLMDDDRQGS